MKRHIMMAISIILVIVSLLNLPEKDTPPIVAGAGNGENSEINTIQDFEALLNYFIQKDKNEIAFSDDLSGITSVASKLVDSSESVKSKHDSVTLSENTYANSKVTEKVITNYDYEHGNHTYKNIAIVHTSFNRILNVYMTEDASYYVSKGSLKVDYKSLDDDVESDSMSMVFDFQMYIEDSEIIMKFNTFDIDCEGMEGVDLSSIIGKWVEVSAEFANEIISMIDELNRGTLSSIQGLIDGGMDGFDRVDGKYTLESEWDEYSSTITVDLNDEENPYIGFVMNYQDGNDHGYMFDSLTFSNVDNTVVECDLGNADVEKLTMEEMAELFGGEI